jgi:hypothetical protein
MAYVRPNFKTKKDLKAAIQKGLNIEVFNPGIGTPIPSNGHVYLEGPHYPEAHRWYGKATMRDGKLVRVS